LIGAGFGDQGVAVAETSWFCRAGFGAGGLLAALTRS